MKINIQTSFLLILAFCLNFLSCKTTSNTRPHYLSPNNLFSFFQYSNQRPPLISAHRGGGYYIGYPENCIESFQYLADSIPVIIECDVAMTKDSVLVLMHDKTLDRTTTGSGLISERTLDQIELLFLRDHTGNTTARKVPTLEQTLEWARDKAVLTLDIKKGVPFAKVVKAVQKYNAEQFALIITYSFKDSEQVYKMAPEIMQSVSIGSNESFLQFQKTGVPFSKVIVFTGVKEPSTDLYKSLHQEGAFCILGTLGNLDKKAATKGDYIYRDFIRNGADILATDRPFEAYEAIKGLIPETSQHYIFLQNRIKQK